MTVAAAALPPVEDVTLEQYAGVSAALVEGFALPAVLETEGLDAAAWPRVSLRWSRRIADDGAGGPLAIAYRDTFAFARRWLGRRVAPLEDDLGAWLGFLNAWSAHPAPFDLLDDLGLSPSDVSRIQGAWADRVASDEDLRDKALRLAKKKPSAIPELTVTRADLRPFPWTKKRAAGTEAAAVDKPRMLSSSYVGDSFGLERYAGLHAELAHAKLGTRAVLARQALTEETFAEMEARWHRRFATDPTLEQDFRRLVRYYDARLRMRPAPEPPAAAPVPVPVRPAPADLAGTALALDVPRGPALPFAQKVDPKVAALAATSLDVKLPLEPVLPFATEAAPPADVAQPAPKVVRPPPELTGTALSLDVPRGPALPFAMSVDPKVAALAATSPDLELPLKAALPFGAEAAPPEGAAKPAPTPAKIERPPAALSGTSPALDLPRGPALPFPKNVDPKVAALAETSLDLGPAIQEALALIRGAAPPADVEKPAPEAARRERPTIQLSGAAAALDVPRGPALPLAEPKTPTLSLEQHASLTVEIALAPERALETIARYGLTPEAKRAVDEHYRVMIAADDKLREAWNQAYQAYGAWLAKAREG